MKFLGNVAELLGSLGLNTRGAVSSRQRIRNGAFTVNQRGVSGTVTLAADAYGHDGWKAGAGGCTYTFAAAANGDATLTISAGTLVQVLEGPLYVPEGGAYALSWAGTATARVYQGTATGAYAATPRLVTGLTAGTNTVVEFSTGTLTLAQFEPGTAATPFERRDDELSRNQRYFCVVAISGRFQAAGASSILGVPIYLPEPMRIQPATVTPTGSGTQANLTNKTVVMYGTRDGIFNLISAAAGDCYALGAGYTFSAEF